MTQLEELIDDRVKTTVNVSQHHGLPQFHEAAGVNNGQDIAYNPIMTGSPCQTDESFMERTDALRRCVKSIDD